MISQPAVSDHGSVKQQTELSIADGNFWQGDNASSAWSGIASSRSMQVVQMNVENQPVSCSISEQKDHNRITVRGRVLTSSAEQGTFSLQVKKTGPSGSSVLSQSGTFSTEAKQETFLGRSEFNLATNDKFNARLEISVRDKTYTCESDGQ
jgi:hypothetical protein